MEFDTTRIQRIWHTLHRDGRWCEDAAAVLLVHIAETFRRMWEGDADSFIEYGLLVRFAVDAVSREDVHLIEQLHHAVRGGATYICGATAAYSLSRCDEEFLYKIARECKQSVTSLRGALT